jgi:hypothetical protein
MKLAIFWNRFFYNYMRDSTMNQWRQMLKLTYMISLFMQRIKFKIRNEVPINFTLYIFVTMSKISDRLCGLVVRVPGYRGRRFDSRRYHIFWEVVGLERGPFWLVSVTEELLEWESSGSGSRKPRLTAMGICCADHETPSICRSWH